VGESGGACSTEKGRFTKGLKVKETTGLRCWLVYARVEMEGWMERRV